MKKLFIIATLALGVLTVPVTANAISTQTYAQASAAEYTVTAYSFTAHSKGQTRVTVGVDSNGTPQYVIKNGKRYSVSASSRSDFQYQFTANITYYFNL